jgi:hypothetical protein
MRAATQLVWALAGSPDPAVPTVAALLTDREGVCAVCGETEQRTADAGKALGNFADLGHLARSDTPRVCAACLWCCSGKPPATLRMWSVVAGADHGPSHPKAWLQGTPCLTLTNRANPRPVADILSNPPAGEWVCTVAVSGQKHVVPFARVNTGAARWTVRMEQADVTATPEQWAHVHEHAMALRRLGVPADAIPLREPRFMRTPDLLARWRIHDAALAGWHTSPLAQLALWTITKETMQ